MIADRYQPVEQIGAGGMATVWSATDTLLGRSVAIKRLLPHLARDPVAAKRFKREAQAAAGLSHPGIVTVFDTGEDEEGPFIVLELIEGTTLSDRLASNGPLDMATMVSVISQIASALDHAHSKGVIHRDVKPANVILDGEGRARLADFGIARTVEDPGTITESGELIGTISYLAPEILAGDPATPNSDVYSLGAVSYELIAGHPPYAAESPAALLEAVRSGTPESLLGKAPDEMVAAVSAAMSRDPTSRPESAGAFAAALVGSATLVMGSVHLARPPEVAAASEDPTNVTTVSSPEAGDGPKGGREMPPGNPQPEPTGRARWLMVAALLGVLVLAAAALTNEADPGTGEDPGGAAAAANSTAVAPTTTTLAPSTTVAPTTTTLAPTTTTVPTTTLPTPTPESVADEIGALLATLRPPEFHPRDADQVGDRLDRVMEEWGNDDREDLARELERAFERVNDLEESEERDLLWDRFVQLAELMGFQIDEGGQGDEGGDGDGND